MPLTVRRVLGDGPFREIGVPAVVAEHEDLIAVGGSVSSLYWPGDATARDHWSPDRIGVYEAGGRRCRLLLTVRWPVWSLAFHPVLPLLAAGTGSYDGGYLYEGELLLVDLRTGGVRVLDSSREIRSVSWADEHTLDLVTAPGNDEADGSHANGFAFSVSLDDWSAAERVAVGTPAGPVVPSPAPSGGEAALARVAPDWRYRPQVRAVEAGADGRVIAVSDAVLAERWDAGGAPLWSVPDGNGGRQLFTAPDGCSVLVNAPGGNPRVRDASGFEGYELVRVSLDGERLDTVAPGFPMSVAAAADGRMVLRHLCHGEADPAVVVSPSGARAGTVELGGCDPFNHAFGVRRAPYPLVLVGDPEKPHRDKWVATVAPGPPPSLLRLFPLEWDAARGAHLFGGPGVVAGGLLVHAGTVYDGRGLLPGNAFTVARDLASGAAAWVFTGDRPATCVDADGDTAYVAFNDGEVVALALDTGALRWRQPLLVHGQPVVARCLAVASPGRLLVGTVDGRVLDCALG